MSFVLFVHFNLGLLQTFLRGSFAGTWAFYTLLDAIVLFIAVVHKTIYLMCYGIHAAYVAGLCLATQFCLTPAVIMVTTSHCCLCMYIVLI